MRSRAEIEARMCRVAAADAARPNLREIQIAEARENAARLDDLADSDEARAAAFDRRQAEAAAKVNVAFYAGESEDISF